MSGKPRYEVQCPKCGYRAVRYANVKKCPKCNGEVTRLAQVSTSFAGVAHSGELAAALARVERLEAAAVEAVALLEYIGGETAIYAGQARLVTAKLRAALEVEK